MSWQVIGTSVIGTSHTVSGKPCQDSHGFQNLPGDIMILAVADGLGTAEKSDTGSRLAVDTALATLAGALGNSPPTADETRAALENAFLTARASLESRADADGLALRDLGTTLICVVLTPDWIACGQIGDGAVVALQPDDTQVTVSSPQRGEYANETVPLTTQDALSMVCYTHQEIKVKALAMISDGLQNLALINPGYLPFIPFFKPFFDLILSKPLDMDQTRTRLETFLNSERICGRTDDDKTFVLAGWLAPVSQEEQSLQFDHL